MIIDTFKAFAIESLDSLLAQKKGTVLDEINSQNDNYILSVNEADYTEHLFESIEISPVELDFDHISVTSEERLIPAEHFPQGYHVVHGKSYKKAVVIYHIPYNGDYQLLKYKTNPFIYWNPYLMLIDDCICFEILPFDDKPDIIKQKADRFISDFEKVIGYHTQQIMRFKENLPTYIESSIKSRKEELLNRRNMLASLGVPLKKVENLPSTFSIPIPKIKKKIKMKPDVTDKPYIADPVIDTKTYFEILQIIHDSGQLFEKYPSNYENKDEESLRDLLIFQLQPRFEGETSGETFNKSGKTDIIIRYEGKNAFVAECKFWGGKKQYLETIDQLFGYLTWRDSKTAIIIFVKNKDFTSVLSQIIESSSQHPCYSKFIDQKDETWFNFQFHFPDDTNKKVMLAILLFHTPSN